MATSSTPADLLIGAVIAVLLALDWCIGKMVSNKPPMAKGVRDPRVRDEIRREELRSLWWRS
jgi:hypothetical protein